MSKLKLFEVTRVITERVWVRAHDEDEAMDFDTLEDHRDDEHADLIEYVWDGADRTDYQLSAEEADDQGVDDLMVNVRINKQGRWEIPAKVINKEND